MQENKHKPDWVKRAENVPYRPAWQDAIPDALKELGEVFFPIPRRRKGWNYPHHLQEKRYDHRSEILNAYLEAGSGYGIACAGDLAVLDIDEKQFIDEIVPYLPDTAYQWTGSGEGVHLFFECEGLNNRVILYYPDAHDCDEEQHSCWVDADGDCFRVQDWSHLGEIKCDPHGYVVGPGSVHPSGNTYGPLKGDEITTIAASDLLYTLNEYLKPDDADESPERFKYGEKVMEESPEPEQGGDTHPFYKLDADDVVPWLTPGKRVAHPVHGSDTNNNFMKNEDRETFICWRHNYGSGNGCGLNPQQLLAVMRTGLDCDNVRRKWKHEKILHWEAWREAVERGLMDYKNIPFAVIIGYARKNGFAEDADDIDRDFYWNLRNAVLYEIKYEDMPPHKQI